MLQYSTAARRRPPFQARAFKQDDRIGKHHVLRKANNHYGVTKREIGNGQNAKSQMWGVNPGLRQGEYLQFFA